MRVLIHDMSAKICACHFTTHEQHIMLIAGVAPKHEHHQYILRERASLSFIILIM